MKRTPKELKEQNGVNFDIRDWDVDPETLIGTKRTTPPPAARPMVDTTKKNCVCPSHATPKQCIEIRYGENVLGEECECACHEGWYQQNEDDR